MSSRVCDEVVPACTRPRAGTGKPETFHRYRVLDAQNLELIPASCPFVPQRVFQNREISNLFSRYRSSKTFVGRDQLREGLFVK